MSCSNCKSTDHSSNQCYRAALWLGLDNDKKRIVGTFNGIAIQPIEMRDVLKALETTTALRFDAESRSLVFDNERSVKGTGTPDYISAREILSGAILTEIGGVGNYIDGGLASVRKINDNFELGFVVPTTIETGEVSSGFITYVASPSDGTSHYRLIRPDTGAASDTVLLGHSNGSIEFAPPITTPLLVPLNNLVNSTGVYSDTPTVSGSQNTNWKYQPMGTSQVITNGSGSRVEVTLCFRMSITGTPARLGVYCDLVNGGSDYQTTFAEGTTRLYTEGLSGQFSHTVILDPNERTQFAFGIWANGSGKIDAIVGSIGEKTPNVELPVITIRRII